MKKRTKQTSQEEMRKENWKKHIMLEKDYTEPCAQWMAERLEALIDYLQYGYAAIAYRKQDGSFCLVRATLIYYEAEFKKAYDANCIRSTIVYWDAEQQAWRTFRIENFLEWKVIM